MDGKSIRQTDRLSEWEREWEHFDKENNEYSPSNSELYWYTHRPFYVNYTWTIIVITLNFMNFVCGQHELYSDTNQMNAQNDIIRMFIWREKPIKDYRWLFDASMEFMTINNRQTNNNE